MRLSRIAIQNFRNFQYLDVGLSDHAVIVGENKVGKSNLLHAIRLVLDPSLPDSSCQLCVEDFWDGLERPLKRDDRIEISLDFADFDKNADHFAVLGEYLILTEPIEARLTYRFQVRADVEGEPTTEADYEFVIFGGDREDNTVSYEVRRDLPFDVLHALRDAEGDIANWRRSPLRPLLDDVSATLDRTQLEALAKQIFAATSAVAQTDEVKGLVDTINSRLEDMVGAGHAVTTALGFSPTDPDRLLRALRLFIDHGSRELSAASLGSANLLYLTLKSLELKNLVEKGQRFHTFLGIEEPEAHLHPHIQRLVYGDFLRMSSEISILMTTHSPHIVSVSPLRSLVLLKRAQDGLSSEGASTAQVDLDDDVVADLERYLDVTRGEMLFAKGVILVEGDAERFVVPALAESLDIDFDELGITVCAVGGTHFEAYVKLLGPSCLDIPTCVLTDGDPKDDGTKRGAARVITLLNAVAPRKKLAGLDETQLLAEAEKRGLFVGEHTMEVDLFTAGAHQALADSLAELAPGPTAQARAVEWGQDPEQLDAKQFLKDIEKIGKGRFAQRLSTKLADAPCPPYIKAAIEHVRDKVR